jgi:nitronate monooxygenase
VSNAGGLGSLPCAMLSVETMRKELAAIGAGTGKAYNVNFFCHTPPAPSAEREAAWRNLLAPYFSEYDIDADSIPAGPGRAPFTTELADALEEFEPRVVSFHFGLPSPELVARVKRWGSKILSSATTVDEARWLERNGVDAVIAQGVEAGGHRALGASGVQVGTAYMLCPEATTSAVHRSALKSVAARETALTNLFTGRPARGIVNRLMKELGPINGLAPAFPLATAAIAPLRAKAEAQGKGDFSPLWCGQNATGCKEIPAAELTRALAEGL